MDLKRLSARLVRLEQALPPAFDKEAAIEELLARLGAYSEAEDIDPPGLTFEEFCTEVKRRDALVNGKCLSSEQATMLKPLNRKGCKTRYSKDTATE